MNDGRVLVLGGSGFIGSAVLAELSNHGISARSFDRTSATNQLPDVDYLIGNYFNSDDIAFALKDCSTVIHALGVLNPGNSQTKRYFGYSDELLAAVKLFDICSELGVRVVYVSSGGTVYGNHGTQSVKETAELRPINHYGALKVCCEMALRATAAQANISYVIARVANPYGGTQDFHRGVGFIDAAVRNALAGNVLEIWGDGSVVRDYIRIEDVAKALVMLATTKCSYDVVNIGTGIGASQLDVVEAMEQSGLSPHIKFLPARSVDLPYSVLDVARLASLSECGCVSLRDGISRRIEELSSM